MVSPSSWPMARPGRSAGRGWWSPRALRAARCWACGSAGRGADWERLQAILYGEERVSQEEYWLARFQAGAAVLRANYDLADAEVERLLTWRSRDQECDGRFQVIEDVFLGRDAPKLPPGDSN